MTIQNVVVTGANRGLGLEFVRQLLIYKSSPINVIAAIRSSSAQLDHLQTQYPNLHVLTLDVTDYGSYSQFVQKCSTIVRGAGIDLLINNAGIYLENSLETVTRDQLIESFDTNSVAPLILTQSLLPLLRKAASSRKTTIANVTSITGSISQFQHGYGYAYGASKAALNIILRILAVDLKKDGIIVIALQPGWVQTDMGGPEATLTTEVSVRGMLDVIRATDVDQSGSFISYDGIVQHW